MSNKVIEYFQQEQIPHIDGNYILFIKTIKLLLNIIITYFSLTYIVTNWPNLNINQFILIVCTISTVLLYILDLNFPICYL